MMKGKKMDKIGRNFVFISGYKCSYFRYGRLTDPAIVFIHGFGANALTFKKVLKHLKGFCCYLIDLPGHGKAEAIPKLEAYSYPLIQEYIHNIVQALGLKRYYLVGHSYGAAIGTIYLSMYKDEVIKSVLLDGGYHDLSYIKKYNEQKQLEPFITSLENICRPYFPELKEELSEEELALYYQDNASYRYINEFGHRPLEAIPKLNIAAPLVFYALHYAPTVSSLVKKMDYQDCSILLLQSSLPLELDELKSEMLASYQKLTQCETAKIMKSYHPVQLEQPAEVAAKIQNYFSV